MGMPSAAFSSAVASLVSASPLLDPFGSVVVSEVLGLTVLSEPVPEGLSVDGEAVEDMALSLLS